MKFKFFFRMVRVVSVQNIQEDKKLLVIVNTSDALKMTQTEILRSLWALVIQLHSVKK